MKLYEINSQLLGLFNTDNDTMPDGENLTPEQAYQALDELILERDEKIENIALLIKETKSDIDAIKAEEDTLTKRRKSKECKMEWLKECLKSTLLIGGDKRFESPKVAITFRKSEKLEVDLDALPQEWKVEKVTVDADKRAITQAVKEGEIVVGAKLVTNYNLQIK